MSSSSAAVEPFHALGMVTAPFAVGRREQVRATMLRYDTVTSGRTVFRFVVGDFMPTHAKRDDRLLLLAQEINRKRDIVQLDAIDGTGISVACSCVEKTTAWIRYALLQWPSARYIGKTEDDTYVQLAVLEAELRALVEYPKLILGYMTLAVLPTRPTRYPERQPMRACVTNIGDCQKKRRAGKPAYTEGCFLGDLENKHTVPGQLRFDKAHVRAPHGVAGKAAKGAGGANGGGFRGSRRDLAEIKGNRSKGDDESPLIKWWRGASVACGLSEEGDDDQIAPSRRVTTGDFTTGHFPWLPRSTMAPFPTGPLAVFGRDLAQEMFADCAYLREYERSAREWDRRTHCRGPRAHLGFASTLCDTVLSHWLATCAANVTVVHTTRTKSHHYMWRGAGLGWMAPSNISLAVHYMKAKPEDPSGPNNTKSGEWTHVHVSVQRASGRAFPSLIYRMQANYSLQVSGHQQLMTCLNPEVFHWYSAECSFEKLEMREAGKARAIKATEQVRGPRPAGMSDAKYLGGHPPGWPYSGCNPSRFRPYPHWPPPAEVTAALRNATEHSVGSDRFIYFGHGPTAAELAPRLRAFVSTIEARGRALLGGERPSILGSILGSFESSAAGDRFECVQAAAAAEPQIFAHLLERELSPDWAMRSTKNIWTAVRMGGARAWADRSVHGVPRLLADLVQVRMAVDCVDDGRGSRLMSADDPARMQARLSLEAFPSESLRVPRIASPIACRRASPSRPLPRRLPSRRTGCWRSTRAATTRTTGGGPEPCAPGTAPHPAGKCTQHHSILAAVRSVGRGTRGTARQRPGRRAAARGESSE